MSERSFPRDGLELTGLRPRRDPKSIIDDYFQQVDRPTPKAIDEAAGIIGGAYRAVEKTGYAQTICIDLVTGVHDATTVLAAMFSEGHEVIPSRWKGDPETRGILCMIGQIEAGNLRAQRDGGAVSGGPFPGLPERLVEVEQFVDDLKQR